MTTPNLLLFIAVACYCISVLGAKWTSGKSISSAFKRASGLFFVFFYGMIAVYLEIVWLGIGALHSLYTMPPKTSGITCSAKA